MDTKARDSGFDKPKFSRMPESKFPNIERYCCLVTPQMHAYKQEVWTTCAELSITSESRYTLADKRTIDLSANSIWMTLRKAAIDWDTVAKFFIADTFVRPRCVAACTIFAARVSVRGAFINIRATETISSVSWQTITVIRTVRVDAWRLRITVMYVELAFVDVHASTYISGKTQLTVRGARERTKKINTRCLISTIFLFSKTFVDIIAVKTISCESILASAIKRSWKIHTIPIRVTAVILRRTFVDVCAVEPVSIETLIAFAIIGTSGVSARGMLMTVVSFACALVDIMTWLLISCKTRWTTAPVRAGCIEAVCCTATKRCTKGTFIYIATVKTVPTESWVAHAAKWTRCGDARRV